MKTNLTLFLGIWSLSLFGQTTITNLVRPALGDSFYYKTDTITGGITITGPGANQSWDYSFLSSNINRSEVYRPVSEGFSGLSFPTADAVVIQGLTENYYKFYSNRVELLGNSIRPGGIPIPGASGANVFAKPAVIQKYPESYLDALTYNVKNSINIPINIIPDSILNLLPLKPDSMRINFITKFTKEADAWGTLKLPSKTWNVLREKRLTESSTTIDAYISKPFPIGWIDVTGLASGIFAGVFGSINTTSYAYVSNETKGLIALINVDTLGVPFSIQYKPDDKVFVKTIDLNKNLGFEIYPNPANAEIQISTVNLTSGIYTCLISDLHGKEFSRNIQFVTKNGILKSDIKSIPSGSYILQLFNINHTEMGKGLFLKM